jgi:hypothetical protein
VAGAVAVALLAAAAWVATRDPGGGRDPEGALGGAPQGADCTPRPYQPCGQGAAPFTDGTRCVQDHADYDRNRANGCEAAPDDADGRPLLEEIRANIVPAADVDTYPVHIADHLQIFCDGSVELRLKAPAGIVLSLEIDGDDGPIETATAVAGTPAVIRLGEERCGGSDATTLRAVVRPRGSDRVAADYVLTRSGNF